MRTAFPPSPVVSMMLLMHDVSVFVRKVEVALKKRKPSPAEASEILEKGLMLDNMLTDLKIVFLTGEAQDSVAMKLYSPIVPPPPTMAWQPMHTPVPTEQFQKVRNQDNVARDYDILGAQEGWAVDDDLSTFSEKRAFSHTENHSQAGSESPEHSTLGGTAIKPTACAESPAEEPPSQPLDTNPEPDEEIKKYLSVTRAVASNTLRATHIRLLTILSKYLWHLHASQSKIPEDVHLVALQEDWNTHIARFAKEICDDVPYALGEVDHLGLPLKDPPGGVAFRAYLSLFPIETAIKAPQTSLKHRKLLARRLKHISNTVGIGMADYILPEHLNGVDGLAGVEDENLGSGEREQRPLLKADAALNDHVSWALSQT